MAPLKCNYIIFANHNKINEKLNIKLYNKNLQISKNLTFLGLRFDPALNFKNQVDYLVEKCANRLNLIKILSNKKFKLTTQTMVKIYTALIRSVLEYTSIMITRLSKLNYKRLQAIQNAALRAIFKIPFMTNSNTIEIISGVSQIKDRFRELNENYILQVLVNNNPIMNPLCEDYLAFAQARHIKIKTILCEHKELINDYISLL